MNTAARTPADLDALIAAAFRDGGSRARSSPSSGKRRPPPSGVVPESMKPRKIEAQIGKGQLSGDKSKTIEHSKVA
jgi:hypothetical protein